MKLNEGLPMMAVPPPTVTLTFDPLIRKPIQIVPRPRYMWHNFGEISSNSYRDIVFTWFLGHCLLPLTFWPQNLISTPMNQNM